jgi:hypothetical protein
MGAPTAVTMAMNINPAEAQNFFGGTGPNLLATGGMDLFWPDATNVQRAPLAAPSAGTFYANPSFSAEPWQVVTDATYVYWADTGTSLIYKCPLGSTCTNPTVVVNLTGMPLPTDGGVESGTPDGGGPDGATPEGGLPEAGVDSATPDAGSFVGFQPPQLIAVDSKYVYWTDSSGDINSQLLTGGPPVTIVNNLNNPNFPPLPSALFANNGLVYWVSSSFGSGVGINVCPANADCTANPGVFAPDPSAVAIATDGTDLYWTDSMPPSVNKCKLGATCATPTVVVTLSGTVSPGNIVVDAKHTYWLDSASGAVFEYSK